MARTKATARIIPCPPPSYAGWTANRLGRRVARNRSFDRRDPSGMDTIVVPSHWAIHTARLQSNGDKKTSLSLSADCNLHDTSTLYSAGLLELPTEILLHVFRFLLPEGQVFHFAPTLKNRIRGVSVHRLAPSYSPIPGSPADGLASLPLLSSLCRRLTEIAYTTFFTENQFVFEVATVGLTSIVSVDDGDLLSWNRIIQAKPDGLAPLGSIGTKYLTSLTLCVSLSSRLPQRHEWYQLERSIQLVSQIFKGSSHKLKSLVVDVGFGHRSLNRVTTNRLEMISSKGLRMQIRNIENEGVKEPMARTMERLARLIAPLVWLEGVKDMRISGVVTAEQMRAYKEELMKYGKRRAEDVEAGPSTKRRRLK